MSVAMKPNNAGWYLCTLTATGEPILAHHWVYACKGTCSEVVGRWNRESMGNRYVCMYWNGEAWAE